MKLLIVTLTILLFFTTGCSTQKRMVVVESKELPAWFSKAHKTTSTQLYATGEGKNREEAIKDALNMMVSTLGVSIASEFDSTVVENRGVVNNYQKTTRSEIQSSVKEIRVSNYELLQSEEFSFNRHLVLIRSDKKKLFDGLKKELEQKFSLIDTRDANQFENIMERFRICKEIKNSLLNTSSTLIVMSSLDKDFDATEYIEKIQRLNSDYKKLQSSITFSIETNEAAQELKAVIYSGLSAKKLQILTQKKSLNTHLTISINSKIQKTSSHGIILARSAISIVVKDNRGTIIGSNKLNITGQSTQGYSLAKESVAQKLHRIVLQDGIEKVIGLSL